jgi:hypothetical protein
MLGLIGWGYFTCAFIYFLSNGKFYIQVIALLFFLCLDVAVHAGQLGFFYTIEKYAWFIGDGSMASFIMAGIVISLIYSRSLRKEKNNFFITAILIATALIAFGFIPGLMEVFLKLMIRLHGLVFVQASVFWYFLSWFLSLI